MFASVLVTTDSSSRTLGSIVALDRAHTPLVLHIMHPSRTLPNGP